MSFYFKFVQLGEEGFVGGMFGAIEWSVGWSVVGSVAWSNERSIDVSL